MKTRRLVVTGRVQGVGYRYWTVATAEALGLSGWVRNRTNGTVEILAHGAAEAVDRLIANCREGPSAARVDTVSEEPASVSDDSGFRQYPTA